MMMAKKNGRASCAALVLALGVIGCGTPSSPTSSVAGARSPASPTGESATGEAGGLAPRAQTTVPFRRILCFGDSVTYGVTSRADRADKGWSSLAPVEGYVPKLERLLVQEYGGDFELIASGVGAETTTEGLDRLGYEVRLYRPELVLLLEGVVDVSNETPRFPLLRDNLSEMMRVVIRHGAPVIIGTYPLLDPNGWRISGLENVPRLNDIIRQEAKKQNVPIADHEKASKNKSGQGPDGLHPNDEGYEILARTWLEKIKELAEQTTT